MLDILIVAAIALLGVAIGVAVALVSWYLVVLIYRELLEFISVYKDERRKCRIEDDYLYTEWVEDFHKEPLNKLREYADAN